MRTHGIALLGVMVAAPGLAGGVGYAQATGYFKKDSRPTLYQPLNLLDGRDATAWCTPTSDPLNELLSFGFGGPTQVDELRITTGNNFDAHTFGEFARVKKLKLSAGRQTQLISLEDRRGPQTVPLTPPMDAARLTVEILDQYPTDDPESPVCLTDVVFVSGGKPLNGPWLTTKLKYDKREAPLVGIWYAGFEGTPDQFLSFHFDGTFRYSYEPYDTKRNKPKVLEGSFAATAAGIRFELGGKKHLAKALMEAKGGGHTLGLDGDLPAELKQVFRSVK